MKQNCRLAQAEGEGASGPRGSREPNPNATEQEAPLGACKPPEGPPNQRDLKTAGPLRLLLEPQQHRSSFTEGLGSHPENRVRQSCWLGQGGGKGPQGPGIPASPNHQRSRTRSLGGLQAPREANKPEGLRTTVPLRIHLTPAAPPETHCRTWVPP